MNIIPELTKVQKLTLQRAIELLVALKFPFAILDSTGLIHGGLEVKAKINRKKQHERKYPHGQRAEYAKQYISGVEISQEITVPCDIYEAEELRSSIMSACHKRWGKGSIVTTLNRPANHIEVLRIK
jgi:hypothetical protein